MRLQFIIKKKERKKEEDFAKHKWRHYFNMIKY